MVQEAQDEADSIIKDAEKTAFSQIKKANDEAQKIKQEVLDYEKQIKLQAESDSDGMEVRRVWRHGRS